MRSHSRWYIVAWFGAGGASLVPDAQEGVPRAGGHGHAVLRHAQARHAVVVPGQDTCGQRQHCGYALVRNSCFTPRTS